MIVDSYEEGQFKTSPPNRPPHQPALSVYAFVVVLAAASIVLVELVVVLVSN